jgi:uncharacterized protein (TIGR03437 family)
MKENNWFRLRVVKGCRIASVAMVSLAVWMLGHAQIAFGQAATVLQVDVENIAYYVGDTTDFAKLATDANAVSPAPSKNFATHIGVGDIVAVNGKPARGTWFWRGATVNATQNAAPGEAVADTTRVYIVELVWEILQADGTPIGTIMASGVTGGMPPPGSPLQQNLGNVAITGGTGAFLAARGQAGVSVSVSPQMRGGRQASVTEDPVNRRTRDGGVLPWILYLIPASSPQIVQTSEGPAIVHSRDFKIVSPTNPARPGEILSLFAKNLGPTRPGVQPGELFPADRMTILNSPVEVRLNGTAAEVLYAGGVPQTSDTYQVNFAVPGTINAGTASVEVRSAWIPSALAQIAIQ